MDIYSVDSDLMGFHGDLMDIYVYIVLYSVNSDVMVV